mmetsp:Transcript_3987/g.9149  ORF Transcript_3987/g.9149 Transcript_3987/m.9149 type:complete len:141 (+) Transcript_3987:83-505(+)
MASLRAVFLVGVLALAAAAPWEQSDDPLAAALASDEECQAGDGDCALNALQTRAEKLSPEGAGAEPAGKPAEAAPAEPAALAEKEAVASTESREERHTCYGRAGPIYGDPRSHCCGRHGYQIICGRTGRCSGSATLPICV